MYVVAVELKRITLDVCNKTGNIVPEGMNK